MSLTFLTSQAVQASMCRVATTALAPVLRRQGKAVMRAIPRLPEPLGARSGWVSGGHREPVLRLMVLGESTAAGVGVAGQDEALPHQLACELATRSRRGVCWQSTAQTGATASFTGRRLIEAAPHDQDLVVVVLGVNDALRFTPSKRWTERLGQLVEVLLREHLRAGGRIVLSGLPPLGTFGIFPQPLRAMLGWHARILDEESCRLAACHTLVGHLPMPDLRWPEMFAEDGLHPSASSYRAWAQHTAGALVQSVPETPLSPGRPP